MSCAGIHTESEIEQLCHLCQLDYGRSAAVFASDERFVQAASQATIAVVPDATQAEYTASSSHSVGVCIQADSPSEMLQYLATVRPRPPTRTAAKLTPRFSPARAGCQAHAPLPP